MFKWIKESNRYKHMIAGLIIFAVMVALSCTIGISYSNASVVALATTAIAMLSVEYIQHTFGCKFDWLDSLAGCLIPIIFTVFILII